MSRQEHESRERNGKQKTQAQKKMGQQAPIYTFRPSKEDKADIRESKLELRAVLLILEGYIQKDCTLTIGYKPENEAYYAIMRTRAHRFEDSLAVSAWHSDLSMALHCLAHALQYKVAQFPDYLPIQASFDTNW